MRARSHSWRVEPEVLSSEPVRRVVVDLLRTRAAELGVTNARVRFVRGQQSPREFIENRPAPLFVEVVQRG